MTEENFALKDMFNRETVKVLALAVKAEYPDFQDKKFIQGVFNEDWEGLALKQRVRQITLTLGDFLPGDYTASLEILKLSLPHLKEQGFEKMVFPDYIEVFGLN